jgi:hypothetical protein
MRNILVFLALILASTFSAPSARSASVTIGANKDNSIYQNFANNSAGGSAGIFVGTAGTGSPRRGFIAFDVAGSVPVGATITSAQLTLYLGKVGGASNQTVGLHRLTADWGEGTAGDSNPTIGNSGMGFAAGAGDATWNARSFGSSLWTSPGATGDFNATASAGAVIAPIVAPPNPSAWLSTPALVNDVQGWLSNPATNFGWVLINTNEASPGTVCAFYSRSATADAGGDPLDPIARPALTITYDAVPEPATAVLLLSASQLLVVGRRRRI